MRISLIDAGKRFNRDWIFRHLQYQFESGQSYAITGPNGSGKSTLLQVLSGTSLMNEGVMKWQGEDASRQVTRSSQEREISNEEVYPYFSFCAPYLEVIEEMTLNEFLQFHQGFKSFLPGLTIEKIISLVGLEKAGNKQIRYYSSGMKQRVKLAQGIFSNVPVVLLDEPCTNLDTNGVELYHSLIAQYCKERLVIVSSNDEVEYSFCNQKINMVDYKRET